MATKRTPQRTPKYHVPQAQNDPPVDQSAEEGGHPHAGIGKFLRCLKTGTIYAWTDAVMVILAGASLGFLGLGAQPPTAEWGVMIAEGQPYIVQAWWICLFPGLAMVTLALGFILVSDGLSRRLRVSS